MPGRGKGRKRKASTEDKNKTKRKPENIEPVILGGDQEEESGMPEINYFDNIFGKINLSNNLSNEKEMIRCGGDELANHIPQNLKEKIIKGQFIYLSLLLKGSLELSDLNYGASLFCITIVSLMYFYF